MLIVLRARGSRGGGLLMHHLWREADGDASGVFMLTVQQVREYGSSTPDDPAGVQQMQTTITATALPPSAAALMAADRVIGSWKDGKASLREAAFIISLTSDPGKSVKDYARALDLCTPVVCRMAESCRAAGLLTRSEDPKDRRRVIIRPTSHGERLARALTGKGA
jgi:hypothetical protein